MEIFENWGDIDGGLWVLSRYGHVLFGITWIGLLYFFNVVQVPAFAELTDSARSEAQRTVTWRALWWFRWAALATFLTGAIMLGIAGDDFAFDRGRGSAIYMGVLLAVTMFLNVWGVIWRMQKIVIRAIGSEADRRTAAKRAGRASRVNTFFSIPMLFFMVFAAHFADRYGDIGELDSGRVIGAWVVLVVIWAFAEASALGLIGGLDSPFNKLVFDDHRNTIVAGIIYWLIMLFIGWELIIGS
ncbi:MAG TPA: urate hydroxylase PuuD [Acidimicrobiales bacterium]